MNVTLIGTNHSLLSKQNEMLAKFAAAMCVGKIKEIKDVHSTYNFDKGFNVAVKSVHISILEHLYLTFMIEGVSRATTHQLVRHRIASYSQESQRYAKVEVGGAWYLVPNSVLIFDFEDRYIKLMDDISYLYEDMLDAGIPKEDARMILPNACLTNIMVSMNAASFIEQCQKRLCSKAQWEITWMYSLMRSTIKNVYPTVYSLAVPNCISSKCKEVKPCSKSFKV